MTQKIVIVDDEYIIAEGIKTMIDRSGLDFQVVASAYDGIAGLKLLKQFRPEVVITDIRMPGMDGLSLIEMAEEFLPETKFVVISGYTEFTYAQRALELGVKAYLDKPVTIEKVTKILRLLQTLPISSRYEGVHHQIDIILNALWQGDSKAINDGTDKYLSALASVTISEEEYINECFLFLSLLADTYKAVNKDSEPVYVASYGEMRDLSGQEKVNAYVFEKILRLCDKVKAKKFGSNHRVILRLLDYINENYHQPIGLNDLAKQVNMNPAYLSILFREEIGVSYVKYLTSIRIGHAKELLLAGHRINDVSLKVGYSDYRYFCDIFKKQTGQTPSTFKGSRRKVDEVN